MPLPPGITTGTVTFGQAVSLIGGGDTAMTIEIKPTHNVVHQATGIQLLDFAETVTLDEGVPGSISLPHTDQAGFIDAAGNTFSGWAYIATGTWRRGNESRSFTKRFQILSGQTSIDLDLLPNGTITVPVSAPVLPVTSFLGKTGAIDEEDLVDLGVGGGGVVDGGVTTAKLAPDAVTSDKIAAGAVNGPELGQDAVTASKIANDAVARAKLASEVRTELDGKLSKGEAAASYAPIGAAGGVDVATATAPANPVQNQIWYRLNADGSISTMKWDTPVADTTAPTAPALAASVDTTTVTLAASGSTDAVGVVGYNFYLSGTKLNGSSPVASPYVHTGRTPSTQYGPYTAKAVDAAGNESAASNTQTVTTTAAATAPSAPATPTLTPGNATISITITAPANGGSAITDYAYRYKLSSSSTWIDLTDGVSTALTATITGATNGSAYDVQAAAINAVGQSAWSSTATATPVAPPTDTTAPTAPTLSSTAVTHNSVTLSFPGSTDANGVTGYRIYDGASLLGTQPSGAATTFQVTGLTPETAHAYTVQARDAAGNWSVSSNTVNVTTSAAPTGLSDIITANLIQDYDPDTLTAIADGATFSGWTPARGSETIALAQSVTGNRPTKRAAKYNGHVAIEYTASASSNSQSTAEWATPVPQPITIFTVIQAKTFAANQVFFSAKNTSASRYTRLYQDTAGVIYCSSGGSTPALAVTPANPLGLLVCCVKINGDLASQLWVNSVAPGATGDAMGTETASGLSSLKIGGDRSGLPADFFIGRLAIYSGAMSDSDTTLMMQYLGTRYGATIS